jgi:hypothetical protein
MRRTVWKFPLKLPGCGWQPMSMPVNSTIRHCQNDPRTGAPALWVEVDSDDHQQTRHFRTFATGDEIPADAEYVGTAVGGAFVWHAYERKAPAA